MRSALDYSTITPTAIPNKKKMVQWNPQGTYNNNLGSGDVVRFNLSSAANDDLFLCPYSTYIAATVSVALNSKLDDDAVITNKIVQIDSSAKGIFSSMTIYERGEELERIQQLDVLSSILTDLDYDTGARYSRDYEGLGGIFSSSTPSPVNTSVNVPMVNDNLIKMSRHWLPHEDLCCYADTNARTAPFGSFQTDSIPSPQGTYTTKNHPLINSQLAWFPGLNYNATAYSSGNDVTEYINNFSSPQEAGSGVLNSIPTINGPLQHYTPSFCSNGFEPWFSKTVPQRYLKNGFIKTDKVVSTTFYIPIYSGIFGQLMHPSNYKLIPMKYFKDLVFEFQFNPHWLFTSWFTSDQSARNYVVKSLVLHGTMVEIRDPNILNEIEREYQNGIRIPTQSFYLGPLQSIANGAVPPTIQVNLGFESLRNIFFCFIPNDYSANAACRKQYRLSMGVTSVQLKVGTDYYPQLAIKGNGGNNYGELNNYEFVRYLFRAFGKLLNPTGISINPHNFAVNCRAMDPSATAATFTGNYQLGFHEENRVLGKAVYAIPLDALNYDNSILGGVNTVNAKPFEIHLNYDASRVFTRNVTMFSFCHYDMILLISPEGIRTLGKA